MHMQAKNTWGEGRGVQAVAAAGWEQAERLEQAGG